MGVIRETDLPGAREGRLRMTRDRYIHIIELPARLSDLIYDYDKQQGDLLINAVKRALGAGGTAPPPKGMEPLVPPVTQ